MTETQGTTALGHGGASDAASESGHPSGNAGGPTHPAEPEAAEAGASAAGGRTAVGRATVPVESPSTATSAGLSARYTRAPGMAPPPETLPAEQRPDSDRSGSSSSIVPVSPPIVSGTATVPVVAPSAVALAPPPTAPVSAPTRPGGVATGRVAVGTLPARALPGVAGAGRVTEAVRTARTTSSAAAARGPRRARLAVKRVDPWSVMKFSFAVSVVLFIVIIVATAVLYLALDRMGVFDSVNQSLGDLMSSANGESTGGGFKITAKGVIGTAALLGAVNIVLVTALATLAAFVYNVCADLVGGVELTLSERD